MKSPKSTEHSDFPEMYFGTAHPKSAGALRSRKRLKARDRQTAFHDGPTQVVGWFLFFSFIEA